ncbi:MAG: DUF1573 domain-containing protein [candidate division Zixibacteria bacterium]|nr:DUF1573 domain-containing protein [candidate division Zixibacteria bacterium]
MLANVIRLSLAVLLLSATAAGQARNDLYSPEPEWDYGEVGIDFEIYHVFKLVNASPKPIHLDSVQAPCDCSWVKISDSALQPGDTCLVTLKFSTKDFYGRTTKVIEVHWQDPRPRYLQLTYSATVGQFFGAVKPEPVSLFLIPGQATRKLSISNPKLPRIELDGVDMHGDFADIKTIKAEAAMGRSLELELTAHPSLKAGTYVGNVRLSIAVEGEKRPLLITIPIKIVRY